MRDPINNCGNLNDYKGTIRRQAFQDPYGEWWVSTPILEFCAMFLPATLWRSEPSSIISVVAEVFVLGSLFAERLQNSYTEESEEDQEDPEETGEEEDDPSELEKQLAADTEEYLAKEQKTPAPPNPSAAPVLKPRHVE